MSSRALRKLQREQEQQKQLEVLSKNNEVDNESEEEEAPAPKALNAFDMLNEGEEYDDRLSGAERLSAAEDSDYPEEAMQHAAKSAGSEKRKAKKKSKKKKTKKNVKDNEQVESAAKSAKANGTVPQMDEIDLALKSLAKKSRDDPPTPSRNTIDEANVQLYRLLAVESKHLNALNEMKRLFGNVALENEDETASTPRRRGRGPQQLDLGGALAGRNSPVSRGQGLAGLALRRNPFILGKEDWPKATSGGLGMELVEKAEDATVEYRFVHSTVYQDVQRQFETCVESMDPQRMIQMLQFNPYHISTLLQVSEIAKQQGDHSVSGDLLERALFSFGRSVHSSFTTALSEGKARLDFRRPENREFWLASWRYTNNLGQRGTWRTAYEWAKLVLSLDPKGDPYCVSLALDQIALRGGQSEHFLELSRSPFFSEDLWRKRPNVDISSSLAEYKLKEARASRASLDQSIKDYPWIFVRLFQELNIDHIPKSIWGEFPRTKREKFDCELYVHNAKDLWNTPEAISFLVEVAESVAASTPTALANGLISLDEARHVLLSGVPALINEVPREYTTMPSSSSDPLPPFDNLKSYNPHPPIDSHPEYQSPFEAAEGFDTPPELETPNPRSPEDHEREVSEVQELQGLQGFFSRLIPWLGAGQVPEDPQVDGIERRAAEMGVPQELIAQNGTRLMELLRRTMGRNQAHAQESRMDWSRNDAREGSEVPDPLVGATVESEFQSESDDDSGQDDHVPEAYDDERNQRWLAGQGVIRVRDFTNQHGTNEGAWPESAFSGQHVVTEYAFRVMQLRQQRTRNFIMDYVLPQGTNQEVKALVRREIEKAQERQGGRS
ncbi:hypothetical protein MMC28_010089 [Mycoblastus sanguinarius]|nr:hypothetical protein [Mycoblastus sanguinarius]